MLTDVKHDPNKDMTEFIKFHLGLKHLMDKGKIDSIVTENLDGIQRFCGTPSGQIHEIHGSNFTEYCHTCDESIMRCFPVYLEKRKCPKCDKKYKMTPNNKISEKITNATLNVILKADVVISFWNKFYEFSTMHRMLSGKHESTKLYVIAKDDISISTHSLS